MERLRDRVSVVAASSAFGVPLPQLRRAIRSGQLAALRTGHALWVRPHDVMRLKAQISSAPGQMHREDGRPRTRSRDQMTQAGARRWPTDHDIGAMTGLVGVAGERGVEGSGMSDHKQQRLNVNAATERQLVCLPGIGARLAARIVAEREAHGPFPSPTDLRHRVRYRTLREAEPFIAFE